MDTPRSVVKIDKNTPGTEVAAETAAALAAASLVFRRSDPNYSKVLARRAIRVYVRVAFLSDANCIEFDHEDLLLMLLHLWLVFRFSSLLISTGAHIVMV